MSADGTKTAIRFAVGMLLGILAMALLAPSAQAVEKYTFNALPPVVVESVRESVDTTYETEQYVYDDAAARETMYDPPMYDFDGDDGAEAPDVFVEIETSGFGRASRVDRRSTNQSVYAEVTMTETDTMSVAVAGSAYREGKDYTSAYVGPQVAFTDGDGAEVYLALGLGGAWIGEKFHPGVNPTIFLSTGYGDFVARIESEKIEEVPGWYYRILADGAVGDDGLRLGLHAESDIGVGPMVGLDLGDGPFAFEARLSHLFEGTRGTWAAMFFFTYVPGT